MPFLALILAAFRALRLATVLAMALRVVNVGALFAAATTDVKRRIIPNVIALLVFVAGLCLRLATQPRVIWESVLVGGILYVALVELVHLGLIGGGDAKLASAASFLVPAAHVPTLLADIAIAGGVLSVLFFAARHLSIVKRPTLPYGVAIAAGTIYRLVTEVMPCSGATFCS